MSDMQDFAGKVVVVTGASRGIGARLVQQYAEAGAKVVFGARRADVLAAFESELRSQGHDAIAVAGDVANSADCEALLGRAIEAHGTVDVLSTTLPFRVCKSRDGRCLTPSWKKCCASISTAQSPASAPLRPP